jgi:hypothetical protein
MSDQEYTDSDEYVNPAAYSIPYLVLWAVENNDPSKRTVERQIQQDCEMRCRMELAKMAHGRGHARVRYSCLAKKNPMEYTQVELLSYGAPPPSGTHWEVTLEPGYVDF